ncbi:SUMF1/EgtB/PvdO family nonheme iron enzyme [Pelagicoccus sp. NFK12]|uniref:SUMF1/EgtB/PvdO family nonheme iron enzyme n=1 Tax=Pelagicoccus enzymogenes TaxID=2773457 RepID=A0A927FA65_9BACT|nr:SUMF1/EgtB/PvdO family nonheme iron enzyme [Pelagicoccus enzymogenes]MBD5781207.1 SUMF1/EgtB/PvdO family nonheme iron enzyme [Pelagicoccus enzymogenes]
MKRKTTSLWKSLMLGGSLLAFGGAALPVDSWAAPTISNVVAEQRPGTGVVDISYDLDHTAGLASSVSLEASLDGVNWQAVSVAAGDIGKFVRVGPGKTILWNAGAEWTLDVFPQVKIRLTADDAHRVGGEFFMPSHYYKFDGDASDYEGDVDGVVGEAVNPSAEAVVGQALRFNGSDGEVAFGPSSELLGSSLFSISFWFNANEVDDRVILSNVTGESYQVGDFELRVRDATGDELGYGAGTLYMGGKDSEGKAIRNAFDAKLEADRWHHIALVVDTSETVGASARLWVDGSEVTEVDAYSGEGLTNRWSGAVGGGSQVLKAGVGFGAGAFSGELDELRIYGRALEAAEAVVLGNADARYELVPAGSFTMGSPTSELGRGSDEVQRRVSLTQFFFMGRTEVTNAQMADVLNWAYGEGLIEVTADAVMNAEGRSEVLLKRDQNQIVFVESDAFSHFAVKEGRENYPCFEVSWYGALAYCNYLTRKEGVLTQAVDLWEWTIDQQATGYRLPTEAEWEFACRAESVSAFYNGSISRPVGPEVDPVLNRVGFYDLNSANEEYPIFAGKGTHPVGLKDPNAHGLFDLHGNVREWCSDWYETDCGGDAMNPAGPRTGTARVIRGGAWNSQAQDCRSANRSSSPPDFAGEGIGFRVVRRQ